MKSWRLKIVALTWLQGGHQIAPQYRNTGLFSARAAAKAASTSPFRQAMPASACAAATGAGCAASAGGATFVAPVAAVFPESGAFEQAARASKASRRPARRLFTMVLPDVRAYRNPAL